MTITSKQGQELFGQPAAWDMVFVPRPRDPIQAAAAFLEDPDTCEHVTIVLDQLIREHERQSKPTLCLLCDANFLRAHPHVIVVMKPATRTGPSATFLLCSACVAKPDLEPRVRAYLSDRLGALDTTWGHA
jgi:hypothetical protein